MTDPSKAILQELVEKYSTLLNAYISTPTEALRERVYLLSSESIAHGQGVLDLSEAHREALLKILDRAQTPQQSEQIAKLATEFLMESLVPFEMTHRGYKETVEKLTITSKALLKARDELEERVKERTEELTKANTELRAEILERKRAQEERERILKEVEQFAEVAQRRAAELQGIIDNMVDAVFVSDSEGRIILANEAGRRLLGLPDLEDVRYFATKLVERMRLRHMDGRPVEFDKMVLVRALSGETVAGEDEIIYNPQTQKDIFVRSSAAPIRGEDGMIIGAVAVTRDVTELLELDKLKDQFIAVAAHELKTPVTGIKGYAQMLLRLKQEDISPKGKKALEAINRQTDRIGRIINELLDISSIQTGRLDLHISRFDLSELIGSVVERCKITTTKHRLLFHSPGPVYVNADRDRIDQVVSSLLDNAIRYSPQGGDIETKVQVLNSEVVVSIQDRGIGIPQGQQERIFQLFYRAHTGTPYDYGGMGVGLFIAREIVTRHNGKIWFKSAQGKGTTFTLTLPLATPTA